MSTQLEHVEWQGFRFYDLIFPLFLFHGRGGDPVFGGVDSPPRVRRLERFICGSFDACSCSSRSVCLTTALQLKWLVHTDDGWTVDVHNHRASPASCSGSRSATASRPSSPCTPAGAAQLTQWSSSCSATGPSSAWVPNPDTGVRGDFTMEGNLGGWVDRHYLPGRLNPNYYGDQKKSIAYGDNEGLLSTIPAVATALLGVLAGEWLRSADRAGRKTLGLLVAGGICLALGNLWGLQFPLIKNLWTSSYVLIAAGWSFLLLALFYGIIDGLKWQRWAFPLVVIGVNAITIYVGQRFIGFPEMTRFFLGGVIREAGNFGPVLMEVGILAFEGLFLYILYRQRLFLRV